MIESLILGSLLHNEDYTRKVLPFLKEGLFRQFRTERSIQDH